MNTPVYGYVYVYVYIQVYKFYHYEQLAHSTLFNQFCAETSEGQLPRLAPKVYADTPMRDLDAALRSQLLPLLEFLYPAHVLAFRNALSLQPDRDHVYLISPIKSARKQLLGPLTIHILPGDTNTGIEPCSPGYSG